jgi:hypothetical protein
MLIFAGRRLLSPPFVVCLSPDEAAARGTEGRFTGGDFEEESLAGLRWLMAGAEEADGGRNRGIAGERDNG